MPTTQDEAGIRERDRSRLDGMRLALQIMSPGRVVCTAVLGAIAAFAVQRAGIDATPEQKLLAIVALTVDAAYIAARLVLARCTSRALIALAAARPQRRVSFAALPPAELEPEDARTIAELDAIALPVAPAAPLPGQQRLRTANRLQQIVTFAPVVIVVAALALSTRSAAMGDPALGGVGVGAAFVCVGAFMPELMVNSIYRATVRRAMGAHLERVRDRLRAGDLVDDGGPALRLLVQRHGVWSVDDARADRVFRQAAQRMRSYRVLQPLILAAVWIVAGVNAVIILTR